jgi:hypothetical protein
VGARQSRGHLEYGAWWGTVIEDGKGAVERSATRYVRAVSSG